MLVSFCLVLKEQINTIFVLVATYFLIKVSSHQHKQKTPPSKSGKSFDYGI